MSSKEVFAGGKSKSESKVKRNLGLGQAYVAGVAAIACGLFMYNCHIPMMLPAHRFLGFLLWFFVWLAYLYFIFHDVKRHALITPVLFVVTLVCVLQAPHVGFLLSQKALEDLALNTLALGAQRGSSGTFTPSAKAGLYDVLAYSIDASNGTLYLVTTYEPDMGPDTCTSGFVLKPVATASPYGSKYYAPSHITGDWYQFSASNDF